MKNAATRNALTKAILSATITSSGEGIGNDDTTTVRIVSIVNAPPINQSCLVEVI